MHNLNGVRDLLLENGFEWIVVYYQGCGDDGECFHAEGYKKGETPEPEVWGHEDTYYGKWSNNEQKHIMKPGEDEWTRMTHHQKEINALFSKFYLKNRKILKHLQDDLSWTLCDSIGYDWCNNEGGQGYIKWNLKTGKAMVAGETNYRATNDVTEHFQINDPVEKVN